MPAFFADLLTTKTLADWKKTIVDTATAVGLRTENWVDGGYTRTLVALFGQLHTYGGSVVRIIAASGFLDTAEGAWLKLLVRNLFGVEAIEATYASAPDSLLLTNTGGGLFVWEPGDIIVAHTSTKATYKTTTGGTLNPGVGQQLLLSLIAEEPGSGSNAAVGAITSMVTTFLGVTCTNVVGLVGLDEEKDPALRARARDSVALLALGGIKRAYEFIARSATDGSGVSLGVTRVRVMPAAGDGTLVVYVATASGSMSGPNVAFVQTAFDATVSPYGLDATAVSASNLSVTAPCTIYLPASLGITELEARTNVLAAMQAYVTGLPIGGVVITPATGKIYWRALLAVAAGANPGTLKAQLTSEVDISVAVNEAPVWAGLLAQTTVVQVT